MLGGQLLSKAWLPPDGRLQQSTRLLLKRAARLLTDDTLQWLERAARRRELAARLQWVVGRLQPLARLQPLVARRPAARRLLG